jgi:hypothetical protein
VGDVPVAAQHDLAPAALRQAVPDAAGTVEEAELGLLALVRTGARGQVERHHRELAEIGLQVAAFGVELGIAEAFDDWSGCRRL